MAFPAVESHFDNEKIKLMFSRISSITFIFALNACFLSGCIYIPTKAAHLYEIQSEQKGCAIAIEAPGDWRSSGHSIALYREHVWVSICVPKKVFDYTVFAGSEVEAFEGNERHPVHFTSGKLIVDRKRGKIIISLQNEGGPYWANGSYKLNWQTNDPPSSR